jgi:hypothetical protein
MKLQPKFLVGFVVIAAALGWLGFTAQEWGNSTIGYATLEQASESGKISYIKGYWVKEKPAETDANLFIFTQ